MFDKYSNEELVAFTILGFAFLCVVVFVLTWILQFLWNFLVPSLFNGPTISMYQSFAIYIALVFVSSFFRGSSSK